MRTNIRLSDPQDSNFESMTADKDLEQKVHHAIRANKLLNSEKIKIWVSGRRVYLEGVVPTEKERNLAYECISDIFGIRHVINYITFPRYSL